MKTFKLLFTFLLAFSFFQMNGQMTQTHKINLSVLTQSINSENINESCSFGQDQNISNEDFTIEVNVGDVVLWEGVSMDAPGSDVVKILSIQHESGKSLFNTSMLTNNGQDKFVLGSVRSGNPGDEEKYSITFQVFNNGVQRDGTFVIDPKIRIRI